MCDSFLPLKRKSGGNQTTCCFPEYVIPRRKKMFAEPSELLFLAEMEEQIFEAR